jgi:hypothetical protein
MPTNTKEYMKEYMKEYNKRQVKINCDVCNHKYFKYKKNQHNTTLKHLIKQLQKQLQ